MAFQCFEHLGVVESRPFRVQLLEFLCSLVQGVHHVQEISLPLVFRFGPGEVVAEGAVEPLGPELLKLYRLAFSSLMPPRGSPLSRYQRAHYHDKSSPDSSESEDTDFK